MGWIVYGLRDPRTAELRYVGFTSQAVERRLFEHRYAARYRTTHLYCWWRSCESEPSLVILDSGEGPWEDGFAREREIISQMRAAGVRLTNLTDGGDGTPGMKASDQARAKISAAHRGRKHSPEHVANQAASLRGVPHPPERRAAISAGIAASGGRVGRDRRITDQEIADIRATFTGREGERAALVRATGWAITTIKRALDESLWQIPESVVGTPIPITVHDRNNPGENGGCKVTADTVRRIRSDYDTGMTVAEIARSVGLGWSQVSRIVKRESWASVA